MTTSNQKMKFRMLPSLGEYLHVKKKRYHMNLSRDIDDQKILQSD